MNEKLEQAIVKIALRENVSEYDKNKMFKLYNKVITELIPLYGKDEEIWWTLNEDEYETSFSSYKYDVTLTRPYRYVSQTNKGYELNTFTFTSLYPNIIVKLYELDILKFNNKAFGELIIDLIKIRPHIKEKYGPSGGGHVSYLIKMIINYTYGILGSKKSRFEARNFNLIAKYCYGIFDMLVAMDVDNRISEIKVDEIKVIDASDKTISMFKEILNKLELPYEVETQPIANEVF